MFWVDDNDEMSVSRHFRVGIILVTILKATRQKETQDVHQQDERMRWLRPRVHDECKPLLTEVTGGPPHGEFYVMMIINV